MTHEPSGQPPGDAQQPRTSRAYRHAACDGITAIAGYDFERLANPFEFGSGKTMCGLCNTAVSHSDVSWIDTGESIADYRRRIRSTFPFTKRLLLWSLAPLVGIILGFVTLFPIGVLMIGKVGNQWQWEVGFIAGGLGAAGGLRVASQLLPPLLMRRGLKLDFRGYD